MLNIKDIKDENNKVIGNIFTISEYKADIRGLSEEVNRLYISRGEIIGADKTKVGNHDIYKDDMENWCVVEETLKAFFEKSPNEFKRIYNELKQESMGYNIAEKIIDSEINKLEEQAKTLKLMRRR